MPSNKSLAEVVAAVLDRHVAPGSRLVLGLSGGIDSVVLLHLLRATQTTHAFQLSCMHVHHGLSPHADTWAEFCTQLCAMHGVPLAIHKVTLARDDPEGIEGAARVARHALFAKIDADFVLTAHHRDDQAETVLLQLLRGAGPKGLAAMAESHRRPGWHARLLRPLLHTSRAEIERYAVRQALEWVEDESNADTAYSRNYLRHAVLPLLTARFPAALTTLARSAALQAEAATLLDDLAKIDAAKYIQDDRLDCSALAALPKPRARNLLRWFIQQHSLRMISERRLDESLRQVVHAAEDAHVRIAIAAERELRRYRGGAYVVAIRDCAAQAPVIWQGEPIVRLEQAGWVIALQSVHGQGLSRKKLTAGRVELGIRQGGERLRLAQNGVHRSLKNLLQESAIPPWQRTCIPLIRCDGDLVWASGIGCDVDYAALANESGLLPVCNRI